MVLPRVVVHSVRGSTQPRDTTKSLGMVCAVSLDGSPRHPEQSTCAVSIALCFAKFHALGETHGGFLFLVILVY